LPSVDKRFFLWKFAEKYKLKMMKRQFGELTKFFGYDIEVDPDKAEELNRTKKGATLFYA
jgi:hypothetical protein